MFSAKRALMQFPKCYENLWILQRLRINYFKLVRKCFCVVPRVDNCIRNGRTFATVGTQTSCKAAVWNRAVSDAEKIVGYPTSYLSLRCLLSDEFSNIALHMRKLVGTSHPLLKTAKSLVYDGHTSIQTRGLVILLISKAAGHPSNFADLLDSEKSSGILQRQRSLAEITEMIHASHLIHKGILNLPCDANSDPSTFSDLQFGNKISVLSGDYLLANACKGLADLRNCKVVDLISEAISDFMQAEFLGNCDKQGNPLPTAGIKVEDWEEKSFLWTASLMAHSCEAALELAGHDQRTKCNAYEFGKNIGLAWQVHSDLKMFAESPSFFDLTLLPVIFHLQNDSNLFHYIYNQVGESVKNLDFEMIHSVISQGKGLEKAKNLLDIYAERAQDILCNFDVSDATQALTNIVHALRE